MHTKDGKSPPVFIVKRYAMIWIWIGACAAIISAAAVAERGWYKTRVAGVQRSWNEPLFPLPPLDDDQDDEEDG